MKAPSSIGMPGHELRAEEQGALAVDGLHPSKVMRPEDPEDAARGLRLCDLAGAAVVVWGGGTQMRLGGVPRRYDVAFSTGRLDRLLEHEPADLICRVQAGMRVAHLQDILRPHGQRLPLDPPHPERATVGGMVAANTNGLGRARYGSVRDWVIGITVAYPSGKVARAGGKVVKNVAGYDLMKLHTGALGTLGVIAELNFKVQTLPQAEATVLGHFDTLSSAMAAGHALARHYLQPAALVVVDREALHECGLQADRPWTLAARAEGYRTEVDAGRAQVVDAIQQSGGRPDTRELPSTFWTAVRDWEAPEDDTVVLYAIGSLTGLPALVEAAGSQGHVIAQPAAGVAHLRTQAATTAVLLERLRRAAGEGGQVVVASAPAAIKPSLDVWGPPPPGFPLMVGLKHALDPNAILNPGRFVGGL